MRLPILFLAVAFLSACHWAGGPQGTTTNLPQIHTTGETTEKPSAKPGDTGGLCGGIAAIQCEIKADYCRISSGECTRIADSSGICRPKPEACILQYEPVCGCDGKTYGNACAAAAEGVSVSRRGKCA